MQEIDNTEILEAARAVPCVEVIDGAAPDRAKKVAGPFYPDQGERLAGILKDLRRRESHCVAVNADGLVMLYRRPRK